MEVIATLQNTAPEESHAMVCVDHTIYVVDGNRILKIEIPRETIWKKIWSYLRFNSK